MPKKGFALIVAAALCVAAADLEPAPPTRATMQRIYAALQVLLPAAVQGHLDDPARAETYESALAEFERESSALAQHGNGLGPGSRLFGRALARDVRRAREFFERREFDSAGFFLESLVDDCVACHSRLPAPDSALADGFLDQPALAELDPLERATVAVATRRFDEALERYETVFQDPNENPIILLGPLIRYLTVALRVERDPARAGAVVATLAERARVSSSVRQDLEAWSERLQTIGPETLRATRIERARERVEAAEERARHPGDPRVLIDLLVASAQLHDLVLQAQRSPAAAAEVYELLGRAELGIGQNIWLSRADLYWETAIRVAPESAAARRAYRHLETEVLAGFSGSSGLHLPLDESARLEELRAMVEGDRDDDVVETWAQERRGARLFSVHCAFCHGREAQGEGPANVLLSSVPADLTRIAARRGGVFPDAEVFALIARRDPLGQHQSPEMPRWGEFWSGRDRIDALVTYLRSIQRPASAP